MRRLLLLVLLIGLAGCTQPRPVTKAPIQGHGTILRVLDASHLELRVEELWDGASSESLPMPLVQRMSIIEATTWLTQSTPSSSYVRNLYTMRVSPGERVSFGGTLDEQELRLAFLGPLY